MAKMIVIYGWPTDPDAFERYYAEHHIPFATEQMPNVTDADNFRVIDTPSGERTPYYRLSQMSFPSMAQLRDAVESDGGKAVLADLDNFATGGAMILFAEA